MYCIKCDFELPNEAKFCSKCGTEMKKIIEPARDETKVKQTVIRGENAYVIKDVKLIKFAYWIIQILTWLLVAFVLLVILVKQNPSGLMLGGGAIFILVFIDKTFWLIKDYPESLLVNHKALTGFANLCGGITIFNGVLITSLTIFMGTYIIEELMYRYKTNIGTVGIIVYFVILGVYGFSLIYYPIRAFILLSKQSDIKLDLTLIKVKHNFSNNIEEVSLRKWNEMKKEFGEENYEIVED